MDVDPGDLALSRRDLNDDSIRLSNALVGVLCRLLRIGGVIGSAIDADEVREVVVRAADRDLALEVRGLERVLRSQLGDRLEDQVFTVLGDNCVGDRARS